MSTKGRGSRGGRRLSDDDEKLWHHVARSVAPVRMKPRVPDTAAPELAAEPAASHLHAEPRVLGHRAEPAGKPHPVQHEPRPRKVPALADFDRRTARRIARGAVEIEARLDLHGMRQGEAHGALRSFLHAAHARGLRVVLVITGKGAPESSARPDHDPGLDPRDRGVLRRNVPRWLAEPELRQIVVSHTPAAIRHGGDGAMYLHLRGRHRI